METSFIKWMCDKAEGFRIYYGDVVLPTEQFSRIKALAEHPCYYPLLLQRAIEGVNLEDGQFFINQNHAGIVVQDMFDYEIQFKALELDNDAAKESALRYIYKQELEG